MARLLPRRLDPCPCPGRDLANRESDGLTTTYTCAACGEFIAELVIGPEP